MFSKLSAKWKAFRRKRPVKITLKVLSAIFKCLATIILVGTITVSVVGCVMMVYVFANFGDGSDIPSLDVLMENETSIVYVMDNATGEFVEQQRMEGTNSIWKDLEEIPLDMQHAIVAIEDERFYEHYGVDWKRTISAMANLVLSRTSNTAGPRSHSSSSGWLPMKTNTASSGKSPRFSAPSSWSRRNIPRNRFSRPISTSCR